MFIKINFFVTTYLQALFLKILCPFEHIKVSGRVFPFGTYDMPKKVIGYTYNSET